MLELLCGFYEPGWLLLSELLEEGGNLSGARLVLQRHLEKSPDSDDAQMAWKRIAQLAAKEGDTLTQFDALVRLSTVKDQTLDEISTCANQVNGLLRDSSAKIGLEERRILLTPLIAAMTRFEGSASATDLSRLAWLCINNQDVKRARQLVQKGLKLDPSNVYLQRFDSGQSVLE